MATEEEAIARTAAGRLWAHPAFTVWKSGDAFMQASARPEAGLVVLADGGAAAARAVDALDDAGLPRWAVVVLGETEPLHEGMGFVGRAEWNVSSAAQIFRSTLQLHAARRENVRLRGDLRTVATRVNHDVRSPLGAIVTNCELIRERGEVPDAAVLEAIVAAADEVSGLMDTLTLVLRASMDPRAPEQCDMSPIVFRALQRVQHEHRQTRASITAPGEWPEVVGVGRYLETVWTCLLTHALLSAGAGSSLRLGWTREPSHHAFWVAVDGTDLSQPCADMFPPFHLLHEQNHRGAMELAIVARLMHVQGGRCACESLPEGGVRFGFTLPHGEVT